MLVGYRTTWGQCCSLSKAFSPPAVTGIQPRLLQPQNTNHYRMGGGGAMGELSAQLPLGAIAILKFVETLPSIVYIRTFS